MGLVPTESVRDLGRMANLLSFILWLKNNRKREKKGEGEGGGLVANKKQNLLYILLRSRWREKGIYSISCFVEYLSIF